MNYVFDGIVKRYGLEEKYVMLLEEDYMVAPDLLHTLTLMEDQKQRFVILGYAITTIIF